MKALRGITARYQATAVPRLPLGWGRRVGRRGSLRSRPRAPGCARARRTGAAPAQGEAAGRGKNICSNLCSFFPIGRFVTSALHQSSIKSLPLLGRGKVRDMYAVGDDKLLIVASDRISAFDVILDDPIPGKGQVLTELTEFWLNKLAHILPNHSTGVKPEDVVAP